MAPTYTDPDRLVDDSRWLPQMPSALGLDQARPRAAGKTGILAKVAVHDPSKYALEPRRYSAPEGGTSVVLSQTSSLSASNRTATTGSITMKDSSSTGVQQNTNNTSVNIRSHRSISNPSFASHHRNGPPVSGVVSNNNHHLSPSIRVLQRHSTSSQTTAASTSNRARRYSSSNSQTVAQNKHLKMKRRNSFEIFDGYTSKQVLASLRHEIETRRRTSTESLDLLNNRGNGTNNDSMDIDCEQKRTVQNYPSDSSGVPQHNNNDAVQMKQSNSARAYVVTLLDKADERITMGKYNEALKALREALGVQRMMVAGVEDERNDKKQQNSTDINNVSVAITLTSIGSVLGKMGQCVEAMESLGEAMRIHYQRRGENLVEVAHTLNVIGVVYKKGGDTDKAMAAYKESLRLRKMVKTNDKDIAISHHNIGNVYYDRRDYVKAMESYLEALNIHYRSNIGLTRGHVHTAVKLHNIGLILYKEGRFDLSLKAYQEALRVRNTTFSSDDMAIANTLKGIGNVYERRGELKNALDAYQKAFNTIKSLFGSDHNDVTMLMSKIGNLKSYIPVSEGEKRSEMSSGHHRHTTVNNTDHHYSNDFTQTSFARAVSDEI